MLAHHACNIRIKETDLELQHTAGISISFWSFAFVQEKSGRVLYLKPEIKIKFGDRLKLRLRLIFFFFLIEAFFIEWKERQNTDQGQNQAEVCIIMDGKTAVCYHRRGHKRRTKIPFTVNSALSPGLPNMCSILLHFQPQLWQCNSTSDMHCETTGNFKVDKVKAKTLSLSFWNSWVQLHSFLPAVETRTSTHPLCQN